MMCFVCNQENGTFKTNSKSFIPDIKFQLIDNNLPLWYLKGQKLSDLLLITLYVLFVLMKNKMYLKFGLSEKHKKFENNPEKFEFEIDYIFSVSN